MAKQISLKLRINKANGQMNFNLKKSSLSKDIQEKLPKLKGIKFDEDAFDFEE